MNIFQRILISMICLPIAAFSVFGFLASFEPGVGPGWKIGYAIVFMACLVASVASWLKRSGQ